MQIVCKHNGEILDKFGYDKLKIDNITELNEENLEKIKNIIKWRETDKWDFEYGIGGWNGDQYYKIKSINFADNNTKIVAKCSKIK